MGINYNEEVKRLDLCKIKQCIVCRRFLPKNPHQIYCSKKCADIGKTKVKGKEHHLYNQKEIKCDNCGKTIYACPASIKMYKHHFCSRRCLGVYTMSHQTNPSSIEKKLANYLIENKISFICQFKYKLGIADFFIKPNLIIECDGIYWHNLPEVKARDKRQTLYLEKEGYTVLHLWEEEINNNIDSCFKKIEALI